MQELSRELARGGLHEDLLKAPVLQGSSFYMLLADGCYRSVVERAPEALAQPLPIEGCFALYGCDKYPQFKLASAYVRAHQLCSHHSLVPGLSRFIAPDKPTVAISRFLHTALQPPKPLPAHRVTLQHLQLEVDTSVIKCVLLEPTA